MGWTLKSSCKKDTLFKDRIKKKFSEAICVFALAPDGDAIGPDLAESRGDR